MPTHIHNNACGCSTSDDANIDPNIVDLYDNINVSNIWCLNELKYDCCKNCIKPYSERNNGLKLQSDEYDGDLILFIPFISQIKLRSFCIMGNIPSEYPHHVKFWINRSDITFNNCKRLKGIQEFELAYDEEGKYYYPTTLHKFLNVSNITLYFDGSHRDMTSINYIGFKGIKTQDKHQIIEAVYEARALTKDHKTKTNTNMTSNIGY